MKREIKLDDYEKFKIGEYFHFLIEKTYVHANQVMELLDPEPKRTAAIVFEELDAVIKKLKSDQPGWAEKWAKQQGESGDDGERAISGYDQLKTAALTGKIGDYTPPNYRQLQNLLVQMAESILVLDPQKQVFNLEELEKIGKQCSQRWGFDIQILLSPKTKNVSWGVHHILSKMRGAELNYTTAQLLNRIDNNYSFLKFETAKIRGLTNNSLKTHPIQALHNTYRHWFATYEGVVDSQLHPYGFLEAIYRRYIFPHQHFPPSSSIHYCLQAGFEAALASIHHDIFTNTGTFINNLGDRLLQHFKDPDALVKQVHAAILQRDIAWSTTDGDGGIQHWIQQFCEKAGEDPDLFYLLYTEDVGDLQCLNFKGVQLLLWDLGITYPRD